MTRRPVLLCVFVCLSITSCDHDYERYPYGGVGHQDGREPHVLWSKLSVRGHTGSHGKKRVRKRNRRALRVFSEESCAIRKAGRDPNIGLALSGGGIRSAAYAMGVMRGLHDAKIGSAGSSPRDSILSKVGYLSTVSGGGFGGGWYVSHRSDENLFGAGSRHLQRVVGAGHYLTSSHYSETVTDLGVKFLVHSFGLPVAALLDEAFHLQFNVYGIRDFYRRAIRRAFLYESLRPGEELSSYPCLTGRLGPEGETMRQYLPGCGVRKPFWIVNMHLILKHAEIPEFRNRSGDAFEVTPLWGGARAVGYVRVRPRAKTQEFWMQPHYAVAISGAAYDSDSLSFESAGNNLGYLLNFDLGYFIRSWNEIPWYREVWWALTSPLPINRVLSWLFPAAWKRDHRFTRRSKYLGLTDGGHFENLGAYALVRRGVRFIMIADAGEDPLATQWDALSAPQQGRAFEDLRKLVHLLQLDFGLTLEVEWDTFRVEGIPTLLIGTVKGMPGRDLRVVVFKAAYQLQQCPRADEAILEAEKARNPDFPDDSLFKQLFREDRFLAYERLGYLTVTRHEKQLRKLLSKALR